MTATHLYVGPTTVYGLPARTPCRVVGRRAGGIQIQTGDGRTWLVGRDQLIPRRRPVSNRERLKTSIKAAA